MTLEILNIEEGPKLATSLTMAVETKMSIKLFVDDGCNKGEWVFRILAAIIGRGIFLWVPDETLNFIK